jgi:hypothetical protein
VYRRYDVPEHDDSPQDRTNLGRGLVFGLVVALPFVWLFHLGNHRGTPSWIVVGAPLVFTTVSVCMGGWAGVSIGRSPSGRGLRQGVLSALVSVVTLISMFGGLVFGSLPAILLGLLAGLVLSAVVERPSLPSLQ